MANLNYIESASMLLSKEILIEFGALYAGLMSIYFYAEFSSLYRKAYRDYIFTK
ncbi:hypothetical protein [Peptostreptococcus sp. MV1]|uniref:hypothetical protein n=1 Tax=Peptostreptococcus sp. MV1 TaxID=1219626 RepID=UPI000B32FA84|nr:hypothetical protein [Peptostreptococcus sp. MV1]